MITNVEKEETRNPLKEIKDKKAGRSSYCKYIKTIQTEIGRDAAKYGVANGVQKSKQRFPAIKQKGESDFMRKYLKLKNNDPSEPATESQAKKRGYSVLIPDELMIKTVDITQTLRLKAAPISYLVIAFEKVICIFDIFKRQKKDKLSFRKYNIVSVYVPANMTNHFQRLELTVNGVAKTFLKVKFRNWYANEVTKQLVELKSNQLKISYK